VAVGAGAGCPAVGERGKERRVENNYNKNNDRNTCVGPSLLGGRGPLRRGPLRRGPLGRGPRGGWCRSRLSGCGREGEGKASRKRL